MRKTLIYLLSFFLISLCAPPIFAEDAKPLTAFYAHDVRRRVQINWIPPLNTANKSAIVSFDISANGMVSRLKVDSPSDWSLYDVAATKAIEISAPFRPLPDGLKKVRVECQFILDADGRRVIAAEKH